MYVVGTILSHPLIDFVLCCSKSVPNLMAVHLGRNARLGCSLPRWISLVPADFVVPHALLVVRDWFWVALTIPLINGKLDGADFLHVL
jgi:hypothetical protein